MLNRLHLNQVGDTMVEVLISMAIVSMILGGAYVTSNKSLIAIRDAQEHVDALKLASAEVELIKSITPTPGLICYTLDGTMQTIATNCTLTNTGAINSTNISPSYKVAITVDAAGTYKVKVNWDTVTGVINGGNVEMYYRADR